MRRWSNLSNYEKGNILIPSLGVVALATITGGTVLINQKIEQGNQEYKQLANPVVIERKKPTEPGILNGLYVEEGRYVLPLSAIPIEKK